MLVSDVKEVTCEVVVHVCKEVKMEWLSLSFSMLLLLLTLFLPLIFPLVLFSSASHIDL